MALVPIDFTIASVDEAGVVTVPPDASYEIRLRSDDSLASLYSDADGTPAANPIDAVDGELRFWIDPGQYKRVNGAVEREFDVGAGGPAALAIASGLSGPYIGANDQSFAFPVAGAWLICAQATCYSSLDDTMCTFQIIIDRDTDPVWVGYSQRHAETANVHVLLPTACGIFTETVGGTERTIGITLGTGFSDTEDAFTVWAIKV